MEQNTIEGLKSFAVKESISGTLSAEVDRLFKDQCENWSLAKDNFSALKTVESKIFESANLNFIVQFNPSRIRSSAAKVDAKSIQERKCFLCIPHLPAEQKGVKVLKNENDFDHNYMILVNPFPIFDKHLTIPDTDHTDQRIRERVGDMLSLANELHDYVLFYNGPKCGASAPDHMHFQAGNKGFMPLERDFDAINEACEVVLKEKDEVKISTFTGITARTFIFRSESKESINRLFKEFYDSFASMVPDEAEPMMNILAMKKGKEYILIVFPRKLHRPSQFFAEGDDNLLISPASVDLGGVFITPQEKDFKKIKLSDINDIIRQITISDDMFDALCMAL